MNRKDFLNLFSLALIHGSNALFPLIIFPYIFTVLTEVEFSLIVVSESIALYVLVVCLYSFDISGIKDIVHSREMKSYERIGSTYWRILFVRMILFTLISSTILLISYFFFNMYLHALTLWMMFPLGMILQGNFYYQATEKNFKLGLIIFISRVVASLSIYFLIKEDGQGLLAISILAGSFLVSGILSMLLVLSKIGIKTSYFNFEGVLGELYAGLAIFVGNFSVSLFRGSNIIILSAVSTPLAVSLYSIAEKVVKSLQALSRPLNELAFPKVVQGIHRKQEGVNPFRIIWLNTRFQILIMLFLIPLFIGVLYIVLYFNIWEKMDEHIVNLITIMSFAILFGIANFMFGTVGLNTLGFHRYYALAISAAGVVSFLTSVTLSYFFSDVGASVSFVMGEVLLFTFFYSKYRRFGREAS